MTPFLDRAAARCFALVPCAGTGSRSGANGPKQYASVAGQALVAHTLQALAQVPRLAATLVVLAPDDQGFDAAAPGFEGEHGWLARCGGTTRAETVANGLAVLRGRGAQADDWVLVHDAARCLLRPEWVDQLIDACLGDEVGGLLALPVADTLKAETGGRAAITVDRAGKWAAQTPQMFRLGLLSEALRQAEGAVTDEASAVEALGHPPKLVVGHFENFKVTWPSDFEQAERLLRGRQPPSVLRAMVPARDFALSQRFYSDLGFTCEFSRDGLAGFRRGGVAFFLQDFYVPQHADNFVLHLSVPDLPEFWDHIQRSHLAKRYGVRAEPPTLRPWGLVDMVLLDPTGVLWRIAQQPEDAA